MVSSKNAKILNNEGVAIMMVTIILACVLMAAMTPFILGGTYNAKNEGTRSTAAQSQQARSSLAYLLGDGTKCALALQGQILSNPSANNANFEAFVALPGNSIGTGAVNGTAKLALAGAPQAGIGLGVKSLTLTPTNWPGTAITFSGHPAAVSVPTTLSVAYQRNSSNALGASELDTDSINLNIVIDPTEGNKIIGCADKLTQACVAEGRKVVEASTSPLTRQNCDPLVAAQLDKGDALAPSTMRCVVSTENAVYCWGGAVEGQVNPSDPQNAPSLITGLPNGASFVQGNGAASCAIEKGTGNLYCWGVGYAAVPSQISLPGPTLKVAMNSANTCALVAITPSPMPSPTPSGGPLIPTTPGDYVYCWGSNQYGELASGSTAPSLTPSLAMTTSTTPLLNSVDLVGNFENFCTLDSAGKVWCWGGADADGYPVGSYNGGPPLSVYAQKVIGLSGVTQVAMGVKSACAIISTGQVKCWGLGDSGQLGDGLIYFSGTGLTSPLTYVFNVFDAVQISVGESYACITNRSGAVKCWGSAEYGEIGNGGNTNIPIAVSGMDSNVVEVQTGYERTCARMACGQIRCMGNNQFGNLGDGTTANSAVPVVTTVITGNSCPSYP